MLLPKRITSIIYHLMFHIFRNGASPCSPFITIFPTKTYKAWQEHHKQSHTLNVNYFDCLKIFLRNCKTNSRSRTSICLDLFKKGQLQGDPHRSLNVHAQVHKLYIMDLGNLWWVQKFQQTFQVTLVSNQPVQMVPLKNQLSISWMMQKHLKGRNQHWSDTTCQISWSIVIHCGGKI